jgi:hypothetical protein
MPPGSADPGRLDREPADPGLYWLPHAHPRVCGPPGRLASEVHIMHFYELHEGDDDVFAEILLVREEEMEPEEFFTVVQSIRRRIQHSYEHDTLVEAIAEELETDYDFIAVTDDRLTAAVNVSKEEEDNFLADLEAPGEDSDYVSILADLQTGEGRPN